VPRLAAWHSYERLCATIDPAGNKTFDLFPDLELDLANPRVYESPDITEEMWQDILIGDGGLWGEFLWDNDWRMSGLLDLPKRATKPITDLTGIDLEVVHRLAHTPSKAELRMAEYYLKYVIWSDEVIGLRRSRSMVNPRSMAGRFRSAAFLPCSCPRSGITSDVPSRR
jgi:hypothetical protein